MECGGATSGLAAASCVSFDAFTITASAEQCVPHPLCQAVVRYTFTLRSAESRILDTFHTEVHLPMLVRGGEAPSPHTGRACVEPQLTSAERLALACFGVCQMSYIVVPFAARIRHIEIRAIPLTDAQLAFFRQLYRGGLAEFYYLADLDLDTMFDWRCTWEGPANASAGAGSGCSCAAQQAALQPPHNGAPPRVLVPMGGGKDSTLLMELLAQQLSQYGTGQGSEPGLGRSGAASAAACATGTATTSGGRDAGRPQLRWMYFGEYVGQYKHYKKLQGLADICPSAHGTCSSGSSSSSSSGNGSGLATSFPVLVAEQRICDLERLSSLSLTPDLPFTDYVIYSCLHIFASAFFALQHDLQYIAVGNEYGANFPHVTHARYGYEVNHQYEKSFAAELAFHNFIRDNISPAIYYFSGLQAMDELEIAQRFCALPPAFHRTILSCNVAEDDDWCSACEKCAFVYLLFAAFLPTQHVMEDVFRAAAAGAGTGSSCTSGSAAAGARHDISHSHGGDDEAAHGKAAAGGAGAGYSGPEALRGVYDMFDSEAHMGMFEALMGLRGHRPLECVGTAEEVLAALYLAYERQQHHHQDHQHQLLPQQCNGGHAEGAHDASAEAATEESAAPKQRLPLLFRVHGDLIQQSGRQKLLKIIRFREVNSSGGDGPSGASADGRGGGGGRTAAAGDDGALRAPHLYPPWYKVPPMELAAPPPPVAKAAACG